MRVKQAVSWFLVFMIVFSAASLLGGPAGSSKDWENPYIDVTQDMWSYQYITELNKVGVLPSSEKFQREAEETRGNLVLYLYNMDQGVFKRREKKDPVRQTPSFSDVTKDSPYYDAVCWAYESGLTGGTSETTFSPDSNTTRAMMAAILWRMAGEEAPEGSSDFTDLAADWYRDAVAWATENGITTGTSETTFSPNSHITREQFVTMLYRYAEKNGLDLSSYITPQEETDLDLDNAVVQEDYTTQGGDLSQFLDGEQVSDYAKRAMEWAVSEGILTGTPEGTLDPQDTATRAEMATMLARYNNT